MDTLKALNKLVHSVPETEKQPDRFNYSPTTTPTFPDTDKELPNECLSTNYIIALLSMMALLVIMMSVVILRNW